MNFEVSLKHARFVFRHNGVPLHIGVKSEDTSVYGEHIPESRIYDAADSVEGSVFFVFFNETSAYPTRYIIRADYFEAAYETFLNEFADVLEPDMYDAESDDLWYNANGNVVDHESAQGYTLRLERIEFP